MRSHKFYHFAYIMENFAQNLVSVNNFLILYTSKVDQQVRLLEIVFCYCYKEIELTFLNVVLKHMMGHLQ